MAKQKQESQKDFYEVLNGIRADWGNVNPCMRVFEDEKKKIPRKKKNSKRLEEDYDYRN